MNRTKIEWCDMTWNPVIGCTHGCAYCYARRMARRFHMTADFAVPTWSERNFNRPFPASRPSRIFVNSMSDVADWEPEWTRRVCGRTKDAPWHTFLFLSKRPWAWTDYSLGPNAMVGYSVTKDADLDGLGGRRFGVSFLSIEPLLGPVNLTERFSNLRWIIVGAETGNRKGKVRPELPWLTAISIYADDQGIPLFFKDSLRSVWPLIDFPQEYPK